MGKRSPQYDVHPGVKMVQDWIASLKVKTGRTLDEWIAHIRRDGPADEKGQRDWLKKKYELGTNTVWYLAEQAREDGTGSAENDPEAYLKTAAGYVEAQYSGKKAALRPIYDQLLGVGRLLGKDVKVCPCKTMVPFYRAHVIANITPATNSRVDLGLAMGKHKGKLPARLIDTGGKEKKDRITHRIAITSPDEIDDAVRKWLRAAYELDGAGD